MILHSLFRRPHGVDLSYEILSILGPDVNVISSVEGDWARDRVLLVIHVVRIGVAGWVRPQHVSWQLVVHSAHHCFDLLKFLLVTLNPFL